MATYYADSSVLTKRHVSELGTSWVQTLMDPDAHHIDFAALCVTTYQFVELTEEVVDEACRLLEQHALRAYDAVQCATALLTDRILLANGEPPIIVLAADDRLLTAAHAEGLAVDNPNRHP